MPHFDYNEVLDSVLMITYPEKAEILQNYRTIIDYDGGNIPFNIPMKVWVYHDDGGIGNNDALSEAEVYDLIKRVNFQFSLNATGMHFYCNHSVTESEIGAISRHLHSHGSYPWL